MDTKTLLGDLNDAQKAAVTHKEGPLLIVAGAGTGKTTVITRRIGWLIAEGLAKPEEILALTFTDKAAGELEERVDTLLPYGYVDLWIQTFHAFGERILRQHCVDIGLPPKFRVFTDTDRWLLLRGHLEELGLSYYRPLGNPTKFLQALLTHFSRAEDELVTPEKYLAYAKELALNEDGAPHLKEETARLTELANAFHVYKRLLREEGALDFSDLINETLRLFRERPAIAARYAAQFKYVLVDEFQDTNWAQYELVKALAGSARNIAVVGDDDQSVYKFRGASISNILDFSRDFPDCARVVLNQNYRSKQEILDFAYRFIQNNNPDRLEAAGSGAIDKHLVSSKGEGGEVSHLHGKDLGDEARAVVSRIRQIKERDETVNWNDFAILVRANDHAEPFLSALQIACVPHEFLASRGLYLRPVSLDVLAYLRAITRLSDSISVYRVLCMPCFDIPHEDVLRMTDFASKKSMTLFDVLKIAATVPDLSPETVKEVANVLTLFLKHAGLVRAKPVTLVVLAFLHEAGYLKALAAKDEAESQEDLRILNHLWRELEQFVAAENDASVKRYIERVDLELDAGDTGTLPLDPEVGPELVRVMTIHGSKGLEFRFVFVVNLVDKRFPTIGREDPIPLPAAFINERLPSGDAHLQEERRLFYVACTRAKEKLFLTSAEDYGGVRKKKLSRFIGESGLAVVEAAHVEPIVDIAPPVALAGTLVLPERMSFSQFESFERCPLQYKFEHVYRIPKLGTASKSFGQSIHTTLHEMLVRYRARSGKNQQSLFDTGPAKGVASLGTVVPVDEMLEIFQEKWIDDWYDSYTARHERFERGREALLAYHGRLKDSTLDIAGLEEPFTLKLGGLSIRGRVDRVDRLPDGTVEIIDYKTGRAKEKPSREQLFIYQLAASRVLGYTPSKLTYLYIEGGSEVSFLGSPEELASFEEHLLATAEAIRKSAFTPTPGKEICRYCDFSKMCSFSVH